MTHTTTTETTAAQPALKITKRQKQLLAMLAKGMTNKQIADELQLSEHTIKVHLWRLYDRIGVNNRTSAIAWASGQATEVTPTNYFNLKSAFAAACRFIDGKASREEFDTYRGQIGVPA